MHISNELLKNRRLLEITVSQREEITSKEMKFKFLLNKDVPNLIYPSYDEKYERNQIRKIFRKKLNQLLRNKAILLLNSSNFIDDIIGLAKYNSLWEIKYSIFPTDFYEYKFSPAIEAWEGRLILLSLIFWQTKIKPSGKLL